jgi:hypothetical protein
METSFDHVWLARDHLDRIISTSGAGIRLPDVSSLTELPKKYSIWIRGSMDSIYAANILLTVSHFCSLFSVCVEKLCLKILAHGFMSFGA